MNAILRLVDLVAKHTKDYSDGWKPWRDQTQVRSKNGMEKHDNHELMEEIIKQQKIEYSPKPAIGRPSRVDTDMRTASYTIEREDRTPTPRPPSVALHEMIKSQRQVHEI